MTLVVAITQRVVVDPATGERRDALDQRWSAFLEHCGLVVLPLPNDPDVSMVLVDAIAPAGLILSGGNDLAVLGGDAVERDENERRLVEWMDTHGRPIVGVCRGAQHLAHMAGGHIERITGHAGTRHVVSPSGREVNSYHDWAITRLPADCIVTASARDGSIEGFTRGRWTAIVWHPERERTAHADDIALFGSIFGRIS